ncbi:endonuclease/exonuclease/phosphatase [Actinomadura terrae]|uniref:endonuclease/exonuclease/phosphatase n=1 Tax=Actinomadura terrae TaxID=604353 RepID=UPI001FA7F14F|nr:endonuclease/exonuclease/phosphatase [Actinomadura terrae]
MAGAGSVGRFTTRGRRAVVAGLVAAVVAVPAPFGVAPAAEAAARATARAAWGVRIHDIQGAAHLSPLNHRAVARVPGIVTASTSNGFWMQDPAPDKDDATSEGVFVFTRTRPRAVVGDNVQVDGRVSEFRPGGASSAGLTRTEIDATGTVVVAHGAPLPAPTVLGPGGRTAPTSRIKDGRGDVERRGGFDPRANGLDFYESLEGMRVRVQDAVAVGPSRDGELPVLPAAGAGAGTRTARGGILQQDGDANPERVLLDDALAPLPTMNVGDRLGGASDGVLDYAYGDFKLLLTATPRRVGGGLAPETTRPALAGELAVATAGLDGLDPDSPPERFQALAGDIVRGLRSPDLIAVSGIGDNSGEADDGTVAADQTVAELITAISAAGGPGYDWRSVNPRDNADGGERGTNSRIGFLFRTDRGLVFGDRPAPAEPMQDEPSPGRLDPAVTPVAVVRRDGTAGLTLSPGRIAPGDAAWADSRKPLAAEITWRGRRVIVVAGQWFGRSSDDQPLFGRFQPPSRPSSWRRDAQARVVAGFVRSVRKVDEKAAVIVAGDLGERETGAPVRRLAQEGGLTDLPERLPAPERYTALTGGNARTLDHILLSPELRRRRHEFDVVHRAAEFADRAGDRDPAVVRIDLSEKRPASPH